MQDGNKPPNKSVMFYFCQPSDTHVPGCVASKNKPPMNACVPQWTDTIKYEEYEEEEEEEEEKEEEEEEDGSGPAKTDNTRAQSKWRETKMTTATTPNNAALIAVHSEVTSEASRPIIIIINTTIPSMLNDDNNNQASKSLGRPVSKLIVILFQSLSFYTLILLFHFTIFGINSKIMHIQMQRDIFYLFFLFSNISLPLAVRFINND
ncbi:hypothetical protein T4E_5483 [Trichinella pseudospiralis]|uniref:Uncharacterized protein n=1 Tax=Trichinella pseudospiralis TaxID=6337 RepID=A0A0V0XRX2_TRIPS|nr:hypothetical protein T4E_5483 [Trichinella pseudospiralis]